MKELGIIIQARLGSTRLPQKMVKPFHENFNILEIILERLTANFDKKIILATTTNPIDNEIERISKKYNVILYRGSEDDVLIRFINAAKQNNITQIIRVCADNPFLEVDYLKQLIAFKKLNEYDYVSFTLMNNLPSIKNHIGLFTEYVTLSTLERVNQLTTEKLYHEHVTNYIYEHKKIFNTHLIDAPQFVKNRDDLRFTLDTGNDFILLQKLFRHYHNSKMNIKELIAYIDTNSAIKNAMKIEIHENSK